MDAKLLVILVTSLISACLALPSDQALPVAENALIPGIFIPTDVLKLFQDETLTAKENKEIKEEKEPDNGVVNTQNSDQTSTVLKPEVHQPGLHEGFQNSVNKQTLVDQSKLSQNHNPNLQDNLNSQPEYITNTLHYQQQGTANSEEWKNRLPNVYYIQPNYNGQLTEYNLNNPHQNVYHSYPPNGYHQQPYQYIPQLNLYSQQPNIYNQQPNVYYQQPNIYYQQPTQYIQQPNAYNQPSVVNSQQPNIYNTQPVFVPQPEANQQVFISDGRYNPTLNNKPNNGVVMHTNQNKAILYAMVPINSNRNSIPNNNAYFTTVQQAGPNAALLISTKDEEY